MRWGPFNRRHERPNPAAEQAEDPFDAAPATPNLQLEAVIPALSGTKITFAVLRQLGQLSAEEFTRIKQDSFFGSYTVVGEDGVPFKYFLPSDPEAGVCSATTVIARERLQALGGLALPVEAVTVVAPSLEPNVAVRIWGIKQLLLNMGQKEEGDFWDGVATGLSANPNLRSDIGPLLNFPVAAGGLYTTLPEVLEEDR